MREFRESAHILRDPPAECSNSSSSKAATSEGPKAYPPWYVEALTDARTPLEDCFSISLGNTCNLRHH